jgi:uncharacterized integral membrane protein (TIGR00698 family)
MTTITPRQEHRPTLGPAAAPGIAQPLRDVVPGLCLALVIATLARWIAGFLPHAVGEVLVAVLLGLLAANLTALPRVTAPGIRFSVHRVLRLGIILLGARLSLGDVAAIGLQAFGLVVLCMAVAFFFAVSAGRALSLPPRLALLIGVGTAVCGNSAIIATAPVVEAEDREVGFAVATITLFGTLAVFVYPLVGRLLGLSDSVFGVWSGVAVNDTSQVVATSAAYSTTSRDIATVVKLVRNTLMAPLIILIAWWWNRRQAPIQSDAARRGAVKAFPLFVLGFLAMSLARTLGLLTPWMAGGIDLAAKLCILVALAAVGLNTRIAQMRAIGATPFYVGFGAAALLAGLSLFLIFGLGLQGVSLHP